MESNFMTTGIDSRAKTEDQIRIEELTTQNSELIEENSNLNLLNTVLRRNTALFGALIANSAGGITLTGPDRCIVRVVKGLTGFAPSDLAGVLIESMAISEDQAVIVDCYRRLLRRECKEVHRDVRVARAGGTIAWFSMTLTDMLDDPNVQCIVLNYLDITAQKELESAGFSATGFKQKSEG